MLIHIYYVWCICIYIFNKISVDSFLLKGLLSSLQPQQHNYYIIYLCKLLFTCLILWLQNAKYSSSKGGYSSSTTSSDSRYEGRMRDSPNGNSYSPACSLGMGMGTDRDSPRNYTSKPLYKKERENRDYKLSSSRDKYSGK